MSHGRGKSDRGVVPKKLPNKAAGEAPAAAEVVEGRRRAKGNALAARMSRRSSRVYDVGTALEGIRQTARCRRDAKFAGLLHHIYAVERLRAAYHALRRDAAPGVDGETWAAYGQALEANLLELSDRLARGGYRPEPVKRAYIDKADGSKRPLGVPALEDKIVQRASAEVLGAIYEQDFLGFSYGFRPGRSAHDALDAVAVGVSARRVNWILDADLAKFFDTIEHAWLIRFIEHRVADARVIRLIKKWLYAGVLEDGQITRSEMGTVQGGSISPLLANIYLHAFDRAGDLDEAEALASGSFRRDMYDVHFIHTETLRRELHDYLISVGLRREAVEFLLTSERVLPEDGLRRPDNDPWQNHYTPALKELVRVRERLIFHLFPEYDGEEG